MTPETFHGFIDTTADTLLIFEACRQGILPMINRRLQERERGAVCSGTVFVFDEKESGIKRWTDGMVWSPSRILGNFLIYRELDGKEPVNGKRALPKEEGFYEKRECLQTEQTSLDRSRERALVGSLSSSYKFKYGGLMKKTMSIMVNGSLQHLISYYSKEDVLGHKLATPSSIPHLACLRISPELLLRQSFRAPPTLDRQHNVFDKASSPASPPLITHTQPITPRKTVFLFISLSILTPPVYYLFRATAISSTTTTATTATAAAPPPTAPPPTEPTPSTTTATAKTAPGTSTTTSTSISTPAEPTPAAAAANSSSSSTSTTAPSTSAQACFRTNRICATPTQEHTTQCRWNDVTTT
ncbi:Gti1/Pac2 family-domain-containing protein [Phycomyces blakesleeanus]